jgi:acetyl esterase
MLDAEARTLLDLMAEATKAGRPRLETLPHAIGRQAVDKMSEDSEADPPDVAETIDGAFAGPGGAIRLPPLPAAGRRGRQPADLDLLSRRRLRDRHHRDPRFDLPAAREQEPLPGDLDRLTACRPSIPFPAPIDDGIAAFRHVRDNAAALGADPARLAVGGDSAGGAIAAVVCQAMRDAQESGAPPSRC